MSGRATPAASITRNRSIRLCGPSKQQGSKELGKGISPIDLGHLARLARHGFTFLIDDPDSFLPAGSVSE